jgi:hypothetical protein
MFNAQKPWKDQLPEALTWFDALKHRVEINVEKILDDIEHTPLSYVANAPLDPQPSHTPSSPCSFGGPSSNSLIGAQVSLPELAHRILRARCPLCFGHETWGGDPNT